MIKKSKCVSTKRQNDVCSFLTSNVIDNIFVIKILPTG